MSTKVKEVNSKNLVKEHLEYDGENFKFHQGELKRVSATHGTSIDRTATLLRNGRFVGGRSSLRRQFYTTPNPRFGFDIDAFEGDDFDLWDWQDIDSVGASIEFASSTDKSGKLYDKVHDLGGIQRGAVIAFGGKLSLEGAEINVDPMEARYEDSLSKGIELVLPRAPKLEAIRGIYPIDQESAEELAILLPELTIPRAA